VPPRRDRTGLDFRQAETRILGGNPDIAGQRSSRPSPRASPFIAAITGFSDDGNSHAGIVFLRGFARRANWLLFSRPLAFAAVYDKNTPDPVRITT